MFNPAVSFTFNTVINKLFYTFFFLLFYGLQCLAQGYAFRHLDTRNGLLSDLRLVLAEDRQGRIWMASAEGINVFDGYQLNSYSSAGASGLLSDNVLYIHCDPAGTMWAVTPFGIQYWKQCDSRFRTLENHNIRTNGNIFLDHTPDSSLLVLSSDGLYLVDKARHTLPLNGLKPVFAQHGIPYSLEHFSGSQWLIGFRHKLLLVDIKGQQLVKTFNYRYNWCAAKVNDSTVLAGSFGHDTLALINTRSGQVSALDWKDESGKRIIGYAGSIDMMADGRLAVASRYQGVYLLDLNKQTATHLVHDPSDPTSIASSNCRRAFLSSNGTLFVCSRGVSYASLNPPLFKTQRWLVNGKGEKYDAGVNAFAQGGDSSMWLATNNFLAYWDKRTGLSKWYPYLINGNYKTVRTVVTDKKGRAWVGSFGGGIGMLQKDGSFKQTLRNAADSLHTLPSSDIHAMVTDPQRNFLICTNFGFAWFNPLTGAMRNFREHVALSSIAFTHTFYAMATKHDWWLCQDDGLYRFRLSDSTLHKVIANDRMQAICSDSAGNMYAGGEKGFYILRDDAYKLLGKDDGLPSDNVMALSADAAGDIWIAGNVGLSRYAKGELTSFDARDGLLQSNHMLCNFYLSSNGEMFTGSADGFNHFSPQQLTATIAPLPVYVTALELQDTVLGFPGGGLVELPYYQNKLNFSFLATDFRLAAYIQYRYRLQGFDSNYVYAGTQRSARYTNLAPGSYTFQVEASADGKHWTAAKTPVHIMITRAYWNNWWFRALVALLLLGAGYAAYRIRIGQIRRAAKMRSNYEIRLSELENSALRAQMNPHFIFNSLNTINAFVNSNDRARSNEYISKFSKLIRLILDHSRQKRISLKDELEVMQLYLQLEQIRFAQRFDVQVHVTGLDADNTEVPPLIIQPFVENAILHGLLPREHRGLLTVAVERLDDCLQCTITDNGIGRKAAGSLKGRNGYNHRSHGMEITLKRIALFNKEYGLEKEIRIIDLTDADGNATGTRFEVPLAYVEAF